MTLALIGNQNCGKTTLFNRLTGSNQHVGNFPGVTVDQKIGDVRGQKNCKIADLPGIYSIRPYTSEEIVTRDFLLSGLPDGIINIIDATNIERNLYLTLQLAAMQLPMVVALNMMDEVKNNGGSIDIPALSRKLGVPVVPITASKNEGVDELIKVAVETVKEKRLPAVRDFCSSGPVHRCIHTVAHQIEDHAEQIGISTRFAAIKVIEGDRDIIEKLALDENERDMIEHAIVQMEEEHRMDRNAALADMRYSYIEKATGDTVIHAKESAEYRRSVAIDRILTGKYTAIPVFLGILFLIFYLTFDLIGGNLTTLFELGIEQLTALVSGWLTAYGLNDVVHSLVIDGIFAGVGSVLSFLPLIVVLFFFLSILEDTGYMARIAFVMDKMLRKIGLSGRSFVPLLIGFGCSVPGILATRTLSSDRDRKLTILLVPFMSCSAKIPIYSVIAYFFFPRYAAFVMIGLYLLGVIIGILIALLLDRTVFRGNPVPFVMEIPNYRLPSPKSVLLLMWEKAKDFLVKAFTVIFFSSLVIWFLQTFDLRMNLAEASGEQSLLEQLGRLIAPLFRPLGFDDWRAPTALLAGLSAKEAVIGTLEVLLLEHETLASIFPTALSALCFLVFTLLYTPCVAAIATVKRELSSVLKTAGVILFQCCVAYLFALLVALIGGLL